MSSNLLFGILSASRMLQTALTFLGIMLVSFGALIILFPMLLQFLIGGLFIMAGIALLGVGLRSRLAPRRPVQPFKQSDVVDQWR